MEASGSGWQHRYEPGTTESQEEGPCTRRSDVTMEITEQVRHDAASGSEELRTDHVRD